MSEAFTPAMMERLRKAVRGLPAMQRAVYRMSARDGLTDGEVARRLSISSDEVVTLLAQALVALYDAVYGDEEDGIP